MFLMNQRMIPKSDVNLNTKNKGTMRLFFCKRMIIVSVCRKCGKESKEEEISLEYSLENRRGKKSSDKICSECN